MTSHINFTNFCWYIIITQVLMFLFGKFVSIQNFRSNQSGEVPKEFKSFYSKEDLIKNKRYTKTNYIFGNIVSTVSLLCTLTFIFMGGLPYLDSTIRQFAMPEIINGLIYFGVIGTLNLLISIPFSLYQTFIIEEKYGFNKMSLSTFFMDLAKGQVMSLLIGAPTLLLSLYLFKKYPDFGWISIWLITFLIEFSISFIYPTVIMPLFNKFEPLQEGELRKALTEYASKAGFPLKDIYVMDGSKRSTRANAFFVGFGKNKRIVFYDTLIDRLSVEELTAVLAHEVGHYKNKHIVKGIIFDFLLSGAELLMISLVIKSPLIYDMFKIAPSVYIGVMFAGLVYSPVSMIIDIYSSISSRSNEYEADQYAVDTTREFKHLISGLKKLSQINLSNLNPSKLYVWLYYSHPTVKEREEAAGEHWERHFLKWQIDSFSTKPQ